MQIAGLFNPDGPVPDTLSRQRIFVCHPANESQEIPCARKIFENLERRAYRRPVSDTDLAGPLEFFKKGRDTYKDFETGIQYGMTAILSSPKFLYRAEPPPKTVAPGSSYKISNLELASRLSFFLWSQGPDDTLL